MKISVLTLFPEMFASVLNSSIMGRAIESGSVSVELVNIRDFSASKHKNADDTPFGGGAGMVMMPQPVFDAMEQIGEPEAWRVYLSPKGHALDDRKARELVQQKHLVLLCGHYEGMDQRVIDHCIDEEISIGDYVLTGGELAAMVVMDAAIRFVPGVLGCDESAHADSFSDGLLEYPQYTRPADFRGMPVPEVLLNGNHAHINRWRRKQQLLLTKERRPELFERAQLTKEDKKLLNELDAEEK